jgi:hypothetical protein
VRRALAVALLLSACAAAPVSPPPPAHVPDGEGIALVGSPLRIDFGRAQDGVVSAVIRLEGRGPAATEGCPGGVTAVRWSSGLSLHFREEAFLGWARPDGTAAGIGCAG